MRRPKASTYSETIGIRLPAGTLEQVARAAEIHRTSPAEFLRRAVLQAADAALKAQERQDQAA